MFTIKTKTNQTNKGVTITARAKGKQKTTAYDPKKGVQANHASAAGVLANTLLSPEQQAKVHHPSGRQRFTIATFNDGTGVINLDV